MDTGRADTGPATTPGREPVTAAEADRLFAGFANAGNLLLAVSGGPDSMALLHLAAQWLQRGRASGAPRPAIHVAVVDHGLRPEAADEARMVIAQAAAAGLPAAALVWEGAKPASGVQVAARKARYALLFAHAGSINASHILTAHHADDQAETILMRLSAGSGLTGLAGMAPWAERGGVVLARPMLSVAKARLVATCEAAGIPWAIDPGNLDPRKGRGRLRQLAGELETLGFGRERLLRLGRRAARADAALENAADAAMARLDLQRSQTSLSFNIHELAAGPEEIFIRVLGRALADVARMQIAAGDGGAGARDVGGAPGALAGSPYGPARLDRLERTCGRLINAALAREAMTTTLGGAVLRLDGQGLCVVAPEPRRRASTP